MGKREGWELHYKIPTWAFALMVAGVSVFYRAYNQTVDMGEENVELESQYEAQLEYYDSHQEIHKIIVDNTQESNEWNEVLEDIDNKLDVLLKETPK